MSLTITHTFSAVGPSPQLHVKKGESFTYAVDVSADFDGSVELRRTRDGGSTVDILATINTADVATTTIYEGDGNYYFQCLLGAGHETITGTAAITLTDVAESAGVMIVDAGVSKPVTISGDIAIDNEGVTAINSGAIVNADINASAAIALSKLAALTSGRIVVGSTGNVPTAVTMSGDATIIASGALTIANSAISTVKIAANAVTAAKTSGVAVLYSLGAPALAAVNRAVTTANMKVGTYTIANQPDMPRNLTATRTVVTVTADTPGTLDIVGTDANDAALTETITVGNDGITVAGLKAFKTVTSITGVGWVIDATEGVADTITVGYGTVLGLPVAIAAGSQVMLGILGTTITAATVTAGAISVSTVDMSAGTYDGSKVAQVFVKN